MRLLLGIICVFFAGNIATAGAQTQSTPPDPGGPAGQEYALPSTDALDQTGAAPPGPGPGSGSPPGRTTDTRGAGATTGGGSAGGASAPSADPRLFGVGVGPAGASQDVGSEDSPGSSPARPSGTGATPRTDGSPAAAGQPGWAELSEGGDGAPIWLLSLIAVGVVAGAGALAFALRRPGVAPPAA